MQQAVSKIQNESTLPSCVDTSLVNETLFASDAEDDTLVKHGSPAIRGEIFQASDSEDVGEESIVQGGGDRCEVFQASDAEEDEPGNCKTDGLKRARQPRTSAKAEFLKKTVCIKALSRLLGVGSSTLQRLRQGHCQVYAGRPKRPKHPVFGFCIDSDTATKWKVVVTFLWHIYHSSAECLPTSGRLQKACQSAEEAAFPETREEEEDSNFSMRFVTQVMRELHVYSSDLDLLRLGPDSGDLAPKRYLQHSTRTELYYEFVAFCEASNQQAASFATFLRVANAVMKPGMRGARLAFRKPGDHAQCDRCWELKDAIRRSSNAAERESNHRALVKHVLSQWLDRQQYWQHRSQSHRWFQQYIAMGDKILGWRILSKVVSKV